MSFLWWKAVMALHKDTNCDKLHVMELSVLKSWIRTNSVSKIIILITYNAYKYQGIISRLLRKSLLTWVKQKSGVMVLSILCLLQCLLLLLIGSYWLDLFDSGLAYGIVDIHVVHLCINKFCNITVWDALQRFQCHIHVYTSYVHTNATKFLQLY